MRATTIMLAVGATLFITASCGGDRLAGVDASPGSSTKPVVSASAGFPTGPAVLVSAGHDPPDDRVDSTGAHLPVNGKPTLVYLEAIW